MGVFNNKKVWHSNLVNQSPLVLMFTSGIMQSKFDDDQKFVYIQVRGDNSQGTYLVLENDRIAERIEKVPQRVYLNVSATGAGDDADISISRLDGNASDARTATFESLSTGNIADDYALALEAARALIAEDDVLQDGGAETLTAIAASLFIPWQRSGFTTPLTADMAASGEESGDDDDDDDGDSTSESEEELPF